MWTALNQEPYDRAANRLFRLYLPDLISLEAQTLERLFNLAQNVTTHSVPSSRGLAAGSSDVSSAADPAVKPREDGHMEGLEQLPQNNLKQFDPIKFEFLLLSAKNCKNKSNPHDQNRLLKLREVFPDQADLANEFILNYHYPHGPIPVLFLLLIDDNQNQALRLYNQTLTHQRLDLDGLLQLYIAHGTPGLQKFVTLLEQEPQLVEYLFQKDKQYSQCMQKNFTKASQLIAEFKSDAHQYQWWMTLLKQHGASQSHCNLSVLVEALLTYSSRAQKRLPGMPIFANECQLANVKSMQAALSRIIVLLKHCNDENKADQLAEVGKLDSSSTGFIKFISKSTLKTIAFVTTEMNITKSRELVLRPDAIDYQIRNAWENIPTLDSGTGLFNQLIPIYFVDNIEHNTRTNIHVYDYSNKELYYIHNNTTRKLIPILPWLNPIPNIAKTINADKRGLDVKYFAQRMLPLSEGHIGSINIYQSMDRLYYCETESYKLFRNNEDQGNYVELPSDTLNEGFGLGIGFQSWLDKDHIEFGIVNTLAQISNHSYVRGYFYNKEDGQVYFIDRINKRNIMRLHVKPTDLEDGFIADQNPSCFLVNHTSQGLRDFQGLSLFSLENTIEQFFRFAAQQNKRGGTPLHLYRYAHDKISQTSFTDDVKCELYALVAGTLSDAIDHVESFQEIQNYLDQIIAFEVPMSVLNRMFFFDSNEVRQYLFFILSMSLPKLPPIQYLHPFLCLVLVDAHAIRGSKTNIQQNIQAISTIFYEGFKDYVKADFEQTDLLRQHLDVCFRLRNYTTGTDWARATNGNTGYDPYMYTIADTLRQLISSFKLAVKIDNAYDITPSTPIDPILKKINELYFEKHKDEIVIKTLTILTQINVRKSGLKSLYPSDLFWILNKIDDLPFNADNQTITQFLDTLQLNDGRLLSAYFMNNKQIKVQSREIEALLQAFVPPESMEVMQTILQRFPHQHQYPFFIQTMRGICQDLPPHEINNLINKIAVSPGLFHGVTSLDKHSSTFMMLLRDVYKNKTEDGLLCFIENERRFVKRASAQQKEAFLNSHSMPSSRGLTAGSTALEASRDPAAKPREDGYTERSLRLFLTQDKDQYFVDNLSERATYYINTIAPALRARRKPPIELIELTPRVLDILLKTPFQAFKQPDFTEKLTALYEQMHTLVQQNPGIKKQFLELFDTHTNAYLPSATAPSPIEYLSQFLNELQDSFSTLDDKNIAIALCLQFKKNKPERSPKTLIDLIKLIKQHGATPQDKANLIQIAIALINNEKPFTLALFEKIAALYATQPNFKHCLLERFFKHAPYPDLDEVIIWHETALSNTTTPYQDQLFEQYKTYDLNPSGKRDPKNGFSATKAKTQFAQFKFDGAIAQVDEAYFDTFEALTKDMQGKSTDALLALYKTASPTHPDSAKMTVETLVAVAAELLFRAKSTNSSREIFELNTTQYLTLLSLLKSGRHTTAGVGTGEGKSRLAMIMGACLLAMGKTSDFVTNDLRLAYRDFVKYQAYLNLIEAKSGMIFQGDDASAYLKHGFNFSDRDNLNLFRNQARSQGRGDEVIDTPAYRALLLDEGDRPYYDTANNRCNYSTARDDIICDIPWVYTIFMDYFRQTSVRLPHGKTLSPLDLFKQDIELSRKTFMRFAREACQDEANRNRLEALSNDKIKEWLAMAVLAKQQIFNEHYDIRRDQLIQLDRDLKMHSDTLLFINNDLSEKSKLSFGAHQCLHAELNFLRENPQFIEDPNLKQTLANCDYSFPIRDEKQIIYSSNSKDLLNDYDDGLLYTLTGTPGSEIEREEAAELYATNHSPMHFMDVPREKGLFRRDRPIRLTRDADQQLEVIIQEIKLAISKNQPVLIFAKNLVESKKLYEKLAKKIPNIQHLSPELSDDEKNAGIELAGLARQVTIATPNFGRGTDIILDEAASVYGLEVIATFLPSEREEIQMAGRSGRYGAKGEYIAILDKQTLKQDLGKSTLADGFYTRTEAYIEDARAKINKQMQRERITLYIQGDFRKMITQHFFNVKEQFQNLDPQNAKALQTLWLEFSQKTDRAWNKRWSRIRTQLKQDTTFDEIDNLLTDYQQDVSRYWQTLRERAIGLQVFTNPLETGNLKNAATALIETLPPLTLSSPSKNCLATDRQPSTTIKYYDYYDRGHDGRAVKYTHWSIPLLASLRGWLNPYSVNDPTARLPFANFRAWYDGHGQLFADFRASEHKEIIMATLLISVLTLGAGVALFFTGSLLPIVPIALMTIGGFLITSILSGTVNRIIETLANNPIGEPQHNPQKHHELNFFKSTTSIATLIKPETAHDDHAIFEPAQVGEFVPSNKSNQIN